MSEPAGEARVLPPEDAKLVTLARSARARVSAPEGAAVRDEIGRTYAAASVELGSFQLSALQGAVGAALSSGAGTIEMAVVVSESEALSPGDLALLAELVVEHSMLVAIDRTTA